MPNKTADKKTEKAKAIDKIPSVEGPEAQADAVQAQSRSQTDVVTDQSPGKRMFQTADGEHKYLTKAEAEKAGFFWRETPDQKGKGIAQEKC
jgi:hypothetical protein